MSMEKDKTSKIRIKRSMKIKNLLFFMKILLHVSHEKWLNAMNPLTLIIVITTFIDNMITHKQKMCNKTQSKIRIEKNKNKIRLIQ